MIHELVVFMVHKCNLLTLEINLNLINKTKHMVQKCSHFSIVGYVIKTQCQSKEQRLL